MDALSQAREADPGDPQVQSALGAVLLQAGRWKEAEHILDAILQANPSDVNALNGLGFIAWQDEHQDGKAAGYFEKALQIDVPSDSFNASLHNSLGAVLCEMGRCAEGIAHFQNAIQLAPADPGYHTNFANALIVLGRFGEARAELEKALMLAPNYTPARTSLQELNQQEHHTH